jgi:YHS domain-containing protein
MKKLFLTTVITCFTIAVSFSQKAEIFSLNGKAIRGYDVVAFFNASQPVKGDEKFAFVWKDATWLFSSQENLELFKKNPDAYAPQYGGYCAYGMSEAHKAPTVPETWKILDNKLYFNYSLKVQDLWNKDQKNYIKKADGHWEKIKNKE